MGILGIFPEILFILEILTAVVIDWIFYSLLEKSQSSLINDASVANDDDGLNDLV